MFVYFFWGDMLINTLIITISHLLLYHVKKIRTSLRMIEKRTVHHIITLIDRLTVVHFLRY